MRAARASTSTPNTGSAADRVDALVSATGYEGGVRIRPIDGLTLTGTYWWLDLKSELLFLGDGGTTEAQGPSKRRGFEVSAFYQPARWLTVDAEFTQSRGRLTDLPAGANYIPGAIETVIAGGVVAKYGKASFAVRARHFGSYSLIEDNSVRADPLTVVNARVEYQLGRVELAADLLNAFNAKDNEIEYFYASRLPRRTRRGRGRSPHTSGGTTSAARFGNRSILIEVVFAKMYEPRFAGKSRVVSFSILNPVASNRAKAAQLPVMNPASYRRASGGLAARQHLATSPALAFSEGPSGRTSRARSRTMPTAVKTLRVAA